MSGDRDLSDLKDLSPICAYTVPSMLKQLVIGHKALMTQGTSKGANMEIGTKVVWAGDSTVPDTYDGPCEGGQCRGIVAKHGEYDGTPSEYVMWEVLCDKHNSGNSDDWYIEVATACLRQI